MTAADIKAAIDHGFADLEALATVAGQAAHISEIEKVKAFLESPLSLEVLAIGVSFGLSKIGAAAVAEPSKAPTA